MKFLFTIEKNLSECQKIWHQLSPDEHLFDNWEYRLCFHKAYKSEPYFIVAQVSNKIVGCLPLEYNSKKNQYIYFGCGDWNEKNKFLVGKEYQEKLIPELLRQLPENTILRFIQTEEFESCNLTQEGELGYYLNPGDFHYDIKQYTETFSKSGKKNVRRAIRNIDELKPTIIENKFDDIDTLISMNVERFGSDSSFVDVNFMDTIKNLLINPAFERNFGMISIYINHKLMAVSLFGHYKKMLVYLSGASDLSNSDVTRYVDYLVIKKAFELKVDYIDLLTGECGWKDHWKMKKEQLYCYP